MHAPSVETSQIHPTNDNQPRKDGPDDETTKEEVISQVLLIVKCGVCEQRGLIRKEVAIQGKEKLECRRCDMSFGDTFTYAVIKRGKGLVQVTDSDEILTNMGMAEPIESANETFMRTNNVLPSMSTQSRNSDGTPNRFRGGLSFCSPGPNMLATARGSI